MKKIFSIILLLSCVSAQAEETKKEITFEVAFADDITAFAKEMPGNIFIAKADADLDALKSEGYDAVVFEAAERDLKEEWTLKTRYLGEKSYAIVIFDTDKKDDIIDWLAA